MPPRRPTFPAHPCRRHQPTSFRLLVELPDPLLRQQLREVTRHVDRLLRGRSSDLSMAVSIGSATAGHIVSARYFGCVRAFIPASQPPIRLQVAPPSDVENSTESRPLVP